MAMRPTSSPDLSRPDGVKRPRVDRWDPPRQIVPLVPPPAPWADGYLPIALAGGRSRHPLKAESASGVSADRVRSSALALPAGQRDPTE